MLRRGNAAVPGFALFPTALVNTLPPLLPSFTYHLEFAEQLLSGWNPIAGSVSVPVCRKVATVTGPDIFVFITPRLAVPNQLHGAFNAPVPP